MNTLSNYIISATSKSFSYFSLFLHYKHFLKKKMCSVQLFSVKPSTSILRATDFGFIIRKITYTSLNSHKKILLRLIPSIMHLFLKFDCNSIKILVSLTGSHVEAGKQLNTIVSQHLIRAQGIPRALFSSPIHCVNFDGVVYYLVYHWI